MKSVSGSGPERERKLAEASSQSHETGLFFGALDASLLVMIDRIRDAKLEIFDSLPGVSDITGNEDFRGKLSEALFEYIFSGFAICFLDRILADGVGSYGKYSITPDYLWEIFSARSLEFKVPELHEFFTGRRDRGVATMFKLMFDCMYERLNVIVPAFSALEGNVAVVAREIVERSMIEGMVLFRSYDEALGSVSGGRR